MILRFSAPLSCDFPAPRSFRTFSAIFWIFPRLYRDLQIFSHLCCDFPAPRSFGSFPHLRRGDLLDLCTFTAILRFSRTSVFQILLHRDRLGSQYLESAPPIPQFSSVGGYQDGVPTTHSQHLSCLSHSLNKLTAT